MWVYSTSLALYVKLTFALPGSSVFISPRINLPTEDLPETVVAGTELLLLAKDVESELSPFP